MKRTFVLFLLLLIFSGNSLANLDGRFIETFSTFCADEDDKDKDEDTKPSDEDEEPDCE
ncbi:MAG: hypothetical protein V3V50_01920 [Gammaproteobacteria bacterium]